jgi:hypothetical protein
MGMANRALYRSRQFFGSIRPRVDAALRDEAFALLGAGERRLFESMTPRDQQHCLAVYRLLREQGHDDRDLLAAALLHDAGKGCVALWHRVAYVLLPRWLLQRIAIEGETPGWRQALYRCLNHAELGARLAQEAGASDATIALIGERLPATDERLRALHAADDAV